MKEQEEEIERLKREIDKIRRLLLDRNRDLDKLKSGEKFDPE